MRLAQRIDLPGSGLVIPVITGDPVADFVAETAEKPVSEATLSSKNMKGYKIAVIELFSNEFRRDLPRVYEELVRRLLTASVVSSTPPSLMGLLLAATLMFCLAQAQSASPRLPRFRPMTSW